MPSSSCAVVRMASQDILPSSSQDDLLKASQRTMPPGDTDISEDNSEADALPTNSNDYLVPDNGVGERFVHEMVAVSSCNSEVYPVPTNSETDFVPSSRTLNEVASNSDLVTNSEAEAFVTNNVDAILDYTENTEIDNSELPTSSQGDQIPPLLDSDSCNVLSSSDGSLMDED